MDQIDFNQIELFDHFNIFKDLFLPGIYFYNTQNVKIVYGEKKQSVNYGNVLTCSEVKTEPKITITAPNSSNEGFSTIIMVNLDGNFVMEDKIDEDKPKELVEKQEHVLQWFVSNIPDNKNITNEGETIVPYLQPLAPYGIGYSRVAFLIFRHHSKLNFEQFRKGEIKNM